MYAYFVCIKYGVAIIRYKVCGKSKLCMTMLANLLNNLDSA